MTKLQLADGSQYDLTTAGFYFTDSNKRTVGFDILTNDDLDTIIDKLSDASKTSEMIVSIDDTEGATYKGYTILNNSYAVKKDVQGYANKISLSLSLPDVIVDNADLNYAVTYASESMPDEDALEHRSLFDDWEEIPEGTEIQQGKRLNYNSGLWKCLKTHNKQSDWYPGAEGTLFEQLDAEEHAGTQEDPIPVPDSVTTSGFTYIVGKYYLSSDGKTYQCKRQGMSDGEECKLYFDPSALIDQYFVEV